ncbi:amidohydrolase family protein [Amnibacterium sp. CER49]|uniref:amidohydrolase family protein n=1 Tax=Amnibacterium sp. CER49 TaxID=3039161 RepID=UPI002448C0D1|nr:amidohydrolase family protein [Amnibacterium sp. CER49]MDH2444491.1 amidohydrolase family protein [Amnibacterium sp. CER49]
MADLVGFVEALPLVDHHVHGSFRADLSRSRFENALNEGSTDPLPEFVSGFDSQLGFAVRRWCAPLLDLPPHAAADDYWSRRAELGESEVNRRFLRAAGVSDWVLDTGFGADEVLSLDEVRDITGARVHEVVRLEAIAAMLLVQGADDYPARFRAEVHAARVRGAAGAKSVLAYRTGFDIDWRRPGDDEVQRAAEAQVAAGNPQLKDRSLIVFGILAAVDAGLPLQLHVGFGDRDLDLHRTNPMLLLPLLRTPEAQAVPVLLLHCYPYEREAGYLAQAFGNVYLDVGLALNYLGARAAALVARSYEAAPFAKVLYSSDAWGPAELHYLGARLWRNAVTRVIGGFVDEGEWSPGDARRVLELSASGNARRLYGLPDS